MPKLLREEKDVKLNDLLRACRKTADHYRLAADILEESAVAGALREVADSRTDLCRRIEHVIRACGYLPDAPNPDRRTAESVAERARAFAAADESDPLAERANRLESTLASGFEAVIRLSWPEDLHRELLRVERKFKNGRHGLKNLLDS